MSSNQRTVFYGWWIVGVGVLMQAISTGTINYSFSVITSPIGAEFSASSSDTLMAMAAMILCAGVMSPLVGALLDKNSIRWLIVIGSVCLSGGYALLSLVNAVWQLVCIYALLISVSTLLLGQLASSTLVARWFTTKRGLALGIATMGTSIGGLIFPPLIQWMIDSLGWRQALQLLAAGTFIITVIPVVVLVKNSPDDIGEYPDGIPGDGNDPTEDTESDALYTSTKPILQSKNFWLIALVAGMVLGIYNGLLGNFIPLASTLHVSTVDGAWLISLLALTGIVGKLIFGVLADRIDLRYGLAAAIVLMLVSLLTLDHVAGFRAVALTCIPLGLATGGILPVWTSMLAQYFGSTNYGRVMGLMSPVLVVFLILGPVLMAAVFDATGSFSNALSGASVLLVLAFMINLLIPNLKN